MTGGTPDQRSDLRWVTIIALGSDAHEAELSRLDQRRDGDS